MIAKAERRWVWGFALAVVLLTSLPYLLGYAIDSGQWFFTGHLFGVEDGHSYLAQMLLGSRGDWLFRSPYSAMEQNGAVVLLPYLLLGKLTAPPGQYEQMIALYHVLRIAGAAGSVWAGYAVAAAFIQNIGLRRWAAVLMTLGGGMGFLRLLIGRTEQVPLEFYSPEAFGFLMLLGIPHLAAARALLLWGVRTFLIGPPRESFTGWLMAGLPWLLTAVFQPLPVIAGCGVMGMYLGLWGLWLFVDGRRSAVEWQPWRAALRKAVQVAFLGAPLVLLTMAVFRLDPALRIWEERNRLLSPPVWEFLLSYSLILPFAAWGGWRVWRKNPRVVLFCAGWVIGGLLWIHIPVTVQRRLVDGAWLALVLLVAAGLEAHPAARRWTSRVLSLSFIAPLLFYIATTASLFQPALPQYHPAAVVEIYQYLTEHAPKDAVVMANVEISSALPAWTPQRVLLGHGPLMLGGAQVEQQVFDFLSGAMDSKQRAAFLRQYRIAYLILGPQEMDRLARQPGALAAFTALDQQGAYTLFEVKHSNGDK